MRFLKFLSISVLFVFVVVGSIGGCNNNSNNLPPGACEMPRFDSDFLGEIFSFVDEENAVLMEVTSDGEFAFIDLTDIPDSGALIALTALVDGRNFADIFEADVFDGEDEIIVDASGEARRRNSGRTLDINDLIVGEIPFGADLSGECEIIAPELLLGLDSGEAPQTILNAVK